MKTSELVMVLNMSGDRGKLKATIMCDRLVEYGIMHIFEKVGDCYTVSVREQDVTFTLGMK